MHPLVSLVSISNSFLAPLVATATSEDHAASRCSDDIPQP